MKSFTIFLFATALLSACDIECDECFTPPPDFAFRIVDRQSGINLIDSETYNADSISLSYFENETEKNVALEFVTNQYDEKIIHAGELGWIAAKGITDYYLNLGHADTDTLQLDIREMSDKCCTWFELKYFFINSKTAQYDWDTYTYLIEK
ncbi:MAG: hypothetical protein JXB00_03660 [Bacteroidales bacterium]|nr:hypothetical protein [Bacteroidales bacterium]